MSFTVAIILAALIVGLAKGGLGPAGALIVPLLSTVMPVPKAIGFALPLLMVGDAFALRAYWRTWDSHLVRLLVPTAAVGILLGVTLLTNLSDDALRRILGVFTLGFAVYKMASAALEKVAYKPRDWHGRLAGGTAGFASALANQGSPPITAYLLLQNLTPLTFVGTNALFFAIVNALKLPVFLATNVLDVPKVVHAAWILPLIPVGVWLGHRIILWIKPKVFEWLMFISLLWAGFGLLLG
jgi:uncharacterized membrane protein YfcA